MNTQKRVSIGEVAKKANVSTMTVSRVIRGEPNVRAATKERVLKAMSELQYVPSPLARSLRSHNYLLSTGTHVFAIIYGRGIEGAQSFFHDIAVGAEKEAANHGLCPLQVNWQSSLDTSWPRLQTVFSIQGLLGAILAGHFYDKEILTIYSKIHNIVMVDGPAPANSPIAAVEADNLGGCLIALQHLIGKGAKNILAMAISPDHYWSIAMKMAVETVRNQVDNIDLIFNCITAKDANERLVALWDGGKKYDAVFSDDECAFGVLKALREMNIRVPNDCKVVGFDDTPFAEFSSPALTSIKIDKYILGSESVKTLIEIAANKNTINSINKVVRASIVTRESS